MITINKSLISCPARLTGDFLVVTTLLESIRRICKLIVTIHVTNKLLAYVLIVDSEHQRHCTVTSVAKKLK